MRHIYGLHSFFVCVCLCYVQKMLKFFNGLFAVFCHEYGYKNNLFLKNGGWRLVLHRYFLFKYVFNGCYGSLDILT